MELPLLSFTLLTLRQHEEVLIIGLVEDSLCGKLSYKDDVIGLQGWGHWKLPPIVGKGSYGMDWCIKGDCCTRSRDRVERVLKTKRTDCGSKSWL